MLKNALIILAAVGLMVALWVVAGLTGEDPWDEIDEGS